MAGYFIVRRYFLLCRHHNINTWALDETLLGAVRNSKFAGRLGDLNYEVTFFDSGFVGVDEHRFDATDFSDYCDANIHGVQVQTSKNPVKYLEALYGADWMTPRVTKTEALERKPYLWSRK